MRGNYFSGIISQQSQRMDTLDAHITTDMVVGRVLVRIPLDCLELGGTDGISSFWVSA